MVLCGGASSRMGRDKALLELDGAAMAARVAETLQRAGAGHVLAVGGDRDALSSLGLTVHPDDHPGQGPLAATITALRVADEAIVMVMACDLLHPSADAIAATVAALAADAHAVGAAPTVGGRRQWAHAAWRRSALVPLQASFDSGERAVHRAAGPLGLIEVLGIDPLHVADADAPDDLP